MKTLIIYATKTDTSEEVANYIASKCDNARVINIGDAVVPALKNFDKIILGSGIYMHKIDKNLKKYIKKNKAELEQKDFGIYYCCGSTDEKKRTSYKNKNFCPEFEKKALAIKCVGGKLNPENAENIFQKIIVYLGMRSAKNKNVLPLEIDYKQLDKFINNVMQVSKKQ